MSLMMLNNILNDIGEYSHLFEHRGIINRSKPQDDRCGQSTVQRLSL